MAIDWGIGLLESRRELPGHLPVVTLVDRCDESGLRIEALDDVELEFRLERVEAFADSGVDPDLRLSESLPDLLLVEPAE